MATPKIVPKLVIGANEAVSARAAREVGADLIWFSGFVASCLLGVSDNDSTAIESWAPLLQGVQRVGLPVILDFGSRGISSTDFGNQIQYVSRLSLGGVCVEDERLPKTNALLVSDKRVLLSPTEMAEKIVIARMTLGTSVQLIARTHSVLTGELLPILQERIQRYMAAGADALCIHYTGTSWDSHKALLNKIYSGPLMVILSNMSELPEAFKRDAPAYIVFPNQLYRMMVHPVLTFTESGKRFSTVRDGSFTNMNLASTESLFGVIDRIQREAAAYGN